LSAQRANRLASSFAIAPASAGSVRLRASTTGRVTAPAPIAASSRANEVDCVLGDDDPALGGRAIEHLVVGTPGKSEVADVPCVMSEIGQLPGDCRAEHLVDE
jgi:hypothetical protein